jgi:hypothetical protein
VIDRADAVGRPTPRRRLVVGAGAAVVLGVGLATYWQGTGVGTTDPSRAAEQVEHLERQRLVALVDADMDVVERLHADDFELVPPPGVPLERDEVIAMVASGELDFHELEPRSDIEVRVAGSSAVVWYRSVIEVDVVNHGRLAHDAWHLFLYEKRHGRWQVVREQTTAVGGFPPMPADPDG